jgi:hypothetical protein
LDQPGARLGSIGARRFGAKIDQRRQLASRSYFVDGSTDEAGSPIKVTVARPY